jgi:antirestriction protein ArdC
MLAEPAISNEPRQEHAGYLQSWLKGLRNDKRFIFSAASHAQKAADFIQELQPKPEKPFQERELERCARSAQTEIC